MNPNTFNPGDKVNVYGLCYRIARIDEDLATVYPVRGRRSRPVSVTLDKLTPWVPKPKTHKDARTCQCCGRAIFARTGTIAHHGYERPTGQGFQTASCFGAMHEPFEVSRDRLGELLQVIEGDIHRANLWIASLETGLAKLTRVVNRVPFQWDRDGRRINDTVECLPGDEHYPATLQVAKAKASRDLNALMNELSAQQKRYDGWKPAK